MKKLPSLFILSLFIFSTAISQTRLTEINASAIQLQNINITEIVNNNTFDLIVIDYSATGGAEAVFSPNQIARIKNSGKLAISYLSIGEAESYRWYWQNHWDANQDGVPDAGAPSWLGYSNPDWHDNYKVRFWDPRWQQIIFSYIDVIISQGFDGIYCDIIDAYYYWAIENNEEPEAASLMIQFINNIRNYIDQHTNKPFYIIAQNAEGIIEQPDVTISERLSFFSAIQGQSCESLFFRGDRFENNNFNPDYYRLNLLNEYTANGVRVFSVEYLTQSDKIQQYVSAIESYNFVPYAANRLLDTLFNGLNGVAPAGSGRVSIAGNVTYYSNGAPVRNTMLSIKGGSTSSVSSDRSGFYEFSNLATDKFYTITPTKTNDYTTSSILSYDAAVAAKIALGLMPGASDEQKIAADVDKNGRVLMYDASLIAAYAVGLSFATDSHVGEWTFNPNNGTYAPLSLDQADQNYQAILLGDVDGNWTEENSLPRGSEMASHFTTVDELRGLPGDKISIPIFAENGTDIFSCDIELTYDPSVLKFNKLQLTSQSQHFHPITNNQNEGHLRIGCYGIKPINSSGKYLELVFEIVGQEGDFSNITFDSYRINAEESYFANLKLTVGTDTPVLADNLELLQNRPNPFNPITTIEYNLKKDSRVVVNVYNMLGQQIITLVDEFQSAGRKTIQWNGRNESGQLVETGVYVYTIKAAGATKSRRMTILK